MKNLVITTYNYLPTMASEPPTELPLTDEQQTLFDEIIKAHAGFGNTEGMFDHTPANRFYLRSIIVKTSPTRNIEIIAYVDMMRQLYSVDVHWQTTKLLLLCDNHQTQLHDEIVRINAESYGVVPIMHEPSKRKDLIAMIHSNVPISSVLMYLQKFNIVDEQNGDFRALQEAAAGTKNYESVMTNLAKQCAS